MASLGGPVSFDRIAECYDATRTLPPDQQDKIARGIIASVRGGFSTRFVEPGVGTGRIALPLLRQGIDYVGTDISPQMLDQLRAKLRVEPWMAGRIKLFEADAGKLPLPDASFDVAITAHLLHLLPDWRRALDEIRRVVRPGGWYIQATDNAGSVQAAFKAEWDQMAASRGLPASPYPLVSVEAVFAHFGLAPAAFKFLTLARWPSRSRVGDIVKRYRDRESSRLWALSDADHASLMAELEARTLATYGSMDAVLEAEASFSIAVMQL